MDVQSLPDPHGLLGLATGRELEDLGSVSGQTLDSLCDLGQSS